MLISEVRMIRRIRGPLGIVVALGLLAAGCAKDPLADLDSTPAAIRATFSNIVVKVGNTAALRASVIDGRTTPLSIPVTFTACDASISVVADTAFNPVPPTASQALITGVTADTSCVNLAGGGQQATVGVIVIP